MNNSQVQAAGLLAGMMVPVVGGAIVGYFVLGKKWWGAVAGGLGGIAFNRIMLQRDAAAVAAQNG